MLLISARRLGVYRRVHMREEVVPVAEFEEAWLHWPSMKSTLDQHERE